MKLAVPSHPEQLWWEKIRKVANQAKLVVLSHSEQVWWEKIVKTDALKKEFVRNKCFVHHSNFYFMYFKHFKSHKRTYITVTWFRCS